MKVHYTLQDIISSLAKKKTINLVLFITENGPTMKTFDSDLDLDKQNFLFAYKLLHVAKHHTTVKILWENVKLLNSLPNDNFLDWSKLKAFADDKIIANFRLLQIERVCRRQFKI